MAVRAYAASLNNFENLIVYAPSVLLLLIT